MRALYLLLILATTICSVNAQMILSDDATGSCDCYELTNTTAQRGSVWSPGTIDLTNPFDFTFEVNLGVEDVWGADGMVFVLRQSGTTSGALGNGLGYSGILPSIGVEIDTWDSSPSVVSDIPSDHLGMHSNGTVEHDLIGPTAIANIEDGLYHTFQVLWDPITFDFEIILDGTSIFVYTGDLVTLFFSGNPNVRFGWTGGTGGVANIQSVCMRRNAAFSSDLVTACEGQDITFTDESTSDLIYNTAEAVTWNWDFGDGTTATTQNPTHAYSTAGTYTVTLTTTDVSGCSSTVSHTVTITPGIDVTMTATNVTCFGLADGTGMVTPLTGTGPYSYLWDDPLSQTTQTAVGLGPSNYSVRVTDAVGCVGSGMITITEPTELVLDAAVSTNASCGMASGTITLSASGGTSPLQYSIDGGTTFQPTGNFTGLSNGSYPVVIRDANGCEVTTTSLVGLDSPLAIDGTITTPASCGVDDGTITINASSGVLPYQYSIDGGVTYQSSNVFSALASGTYTVAVLDDAGCSVTATVSVTSLSSVVIDLVTVGGTLCAGGADGTIDITASAGLAPYTYSIDGGTTFFPTSSFTGVNAGTYSIEVLDANGCSETATATVTEPTPITIDAVLNTTISCEGLADGAFELVVSGGTPPYLYSNDGGTTLVGSSSFTGLSAGTYNVVIQDANGCSLSSTVDVLEPSLVVIDGLATVDVTCNGLMDGEVTVTASGGTAPYQYRIDGGGYQVSPVFTGLGGGAFSIEMMDANGCTVTASGVLNESDPLLVTLGTDTTICIGGSAELCADLSGGTAPYSYSWDGGMPSVDSCISTSTLGTHTLQVVDVNGCTSDIASKFVNQYEPLSLFSSSSITVCPGDEVTISGEASGEGPAAYSYQWTNDRDAGVLEGAVQSVSPEETTIYTLTVSAGCENTATSTITITTFEVPEIIVSADVTQGCQALEVSLVSLTDPTLLAATQWNLGDGFMTAGTSVNHTYEDADCYDVTVDITTVNGCKSQKVLPDHICVWQNPVANFSYTPTSPDLFNRTVEFQNNSENGDFYNWSFGDGNLSSEFNPTNTYPEIGNETYLVKLEVTTDKGCFDRTTQYVKVDEIVLYYIPNAFTPNTSPFNQTFDPVFIPGFFPSQYSFKIFNRWGELLFETQDPTVGWDGTYGGIIQQDGTYTWQLTFRENSTDKKHSYVGHVVLLQ